MKPLRNGKETDTAQSAARGKGNSPWAAVPDELWRDWRWQLRNSVVAPAELAALGLLSPDQAADLERVVRVYPMRATPYYLSLVDWEDPEDPIRTQALPSPQELVVDPRLEDDPLAEERYSPVPNVVHRYPDRVLLLVNTFCPVICRHCTRKRLMRGAPRFAARKQLERALAYIERQPRVHDVLLSGGNPLSSSLARLDWLLSKFSSIEHVEVIRIGTREPVTLPQRLLDPDLLSVLRRHRAKLWMNTHFNHPREVTPLAAEAIENVLQLGIPVNNQTVLLRGVNDDRDTLYQLFRALLRIKVRPYYLLHADATQGTAHFRTSVLRGMQILESLRGELSGLGIPVYVVDSPRLGKLPIAPQYAFPCGGGYVELRKPGSPPVRYPDGK